MSRGHYEIEVANTGGFYLHLSFFHEDCVDRIKEEVPSEERRWESSEKRWWISEDYIDEVEEIVSDFFDEG